MIEGSEERRPAFVLYATFPSNLDWEVQFTSILTKMDRICIALGYDKVIKAQTAYDKTFSFLRLYCLVVWRGHPWAPNLHGVLLALTGKMNEMPYTIIISDIGVGSTNKMGQLGSWQVLQRSKCSVSIQTNSERAECWMLGHLYAPIQ